MTAIFAEYCCRLNIVIKYQPVYFVFSLLYVGHQDQFVQACIYKNQHVGNQSDQVGASVVFSCHSVLKFLQQQHQSTWYKSFFTGYYQFTVWQYLASTFVSRGFIVCIFITVHSIPCSANFFAAWSDWYTIVPVETIVTSAPSHSVIALPISKHNRIYTP